MTIDGKITTLLEAFEKKPILSLYIPRPLIQVGGEKFRIFQKNLLSALEEDYTGFPNAIAFVEDLKIQDFRGQGIAYFTDGESQKVLQLARRPRAVIAQRDRPFMLPALAAQPGEVTRYVLALDKEEPVVYTFDGEDLETVGGIDELPNYEEIEERRVVQDDVFYHSAQRGAVGGHRGPAKFHALGAAVGAEREKTDDAYFLNVGKKLAAVLPPQVDRLTVAGDPRTIGRFAEIFPNDEVEITYLEGAGDALTPERLTESLRDQRSPNVDLEGETISARAELDQAATRGNVSTIFLHTNAALLERRGDSEHLRLMFADEIHADLFWRNGVLLDAIKNGADVRWMADSVDLGSEGVRAATRWDPAQSA